MAFFTADQIAHLSASTVRLDFLTEFRFASGTMRVWNGNTELSSGGETWLPLRGMGYVDGLSMPVGTAAESVTFTMSGIPDDPAGLLAKALEDPTDAEQQMVIVYLQLFDEDWQASGSPIGIWWGFMQPARVSRTPMSEMEGAVQSVTMTAENAFFNRSRPPYGRYTDRDQQKRSDGDKFFQFTSSLSFKRFWFPV